MNISKSITTLGVGAAIVAGSMMAVTVASAQSSPEQKAERVSELSERFNLDETEVQAYFEEKKSEHQAKRTEMRAEHVAGLVEAGTLTQEQADELSALKDSFKTEVVALKDSGADHEEIKTAMQGNRAEVEAWADAEGINLDNIKPEHGEKRGHKGMRN
jgi:hypothetical protein